MTYKGHKIHNKENRPTFFTFWSDDDDDYITVCPMHYPGGSAFGSTPDESVRQMLEVIELIDDNALFEADVAISYIDGTIHKTESQDEVD